MNALVIKSDNSWKIVNQNDLDLDKLQEIVGGYIELVSVNTKINLFCNEEGKIKNLPVNTIATKFIKTHKHFNDVLCGDVVFINNLGDDSLGLEQEELNNIIDYIEFQQNQ